MEYILAFGSAHKALKAEDALKLSSIPMRLLPAPKAFSGYCDLVISVNEGDLKAAVERLKDSGVRPKSVYRKEGDSYVKV